MSTIKANRYENTATTDGGIDINTSGLVGIGTASPKRLLHLNGGSETVKLQITNTSTGSGSDGDGFQIGIATDGTAGIEQRENADLTFATNNTQRMQIDSSGNVGIGTSSPSDKLTVAGNINLPNVNSYIKGGGHNVLQVDATRTYLYGGTNGVQFRTADNASEIASISNTGAATFAGGAGVGGGAEIIVGVGNAAFKVNDNSGTTIIGGSGATFGGAISWANADAVLESINSNADAQIKATTTSANIYIKSGNQIGVIQSGTGWISASSIRIKNVVDNVDPNQCWEFVKNISLKRYYYKDQQQEGVTYLGPIAEEISALDSEMSVMTNQEDSEGKIPSYNQPLMHMKALSALQTALVRIETLEQRLSDAGIA